MSSTRRLTETANKINPSPVRPTRASAHAPVREDHDPENDYEGEMALTQLKTLEEKAAKIAEMLKPDSKLEAWVQSKITMAEDYISTVHDYLKNTPDSIG